MPTMLNESRSGEGGVHDWLEQINNGTDVTDLGASPLATVCASAVDPLEIAVALEVAGISHAVATDRYNRADVFALARTLWARIPLRPVAAKPATLPRSGDLRDIARGVLYILPALMLFALTKAFDLQLARWVLPVAISWGWGLSQVAAFVGYRVQGAALSHEAAMTLRIVGGAMFSTLLLSTGVALVAGGGITAIAATTGLVSYMVASGILLVRAEERWLAALLVPGSIAAIVVLSGPKGSTPSQVLAIVVVNGSFLAVVVRALRRPRFRIDGGGGTFDRHDMAVAAGHLLHGVICGIAVTLVVVPLGDASDNEFGRIIVPVPLLASLGIMEWQLHTFRSRIARSIHTLDWIGMFPHTARLEFFRAFTICATALVIPAIAVMIAMRIHGSDVATIALIAQCVLGLTFFTDLIVGLLDRLDLVLRSWLSGIAVGALTLGAALVFTTADANTVAFVAAAVAVAVVLSSLLIQAREVVSAAMNH